MHGPGGGVFAGTADCRLGVLAAGQSVTVQTQVAVPTIIALPPGLPAPVLRVVAQASAPV